jgi:hypothetical protein
MCLFMMISLKEMCTFSITIYNKFLVANHIVVALNKLHKTLVANDDVMMMSSHIHWMEYVFELITLNHITHVAIMQLVTNL